jgi:NAD(P)-dependent dehydrogenase (short-subunit alcohol dehydrogenase family)
MANLIALVTGANKGIGYEIARQLAKLRHTVLIGARDVQRGREAANRLQSEGLDARFVHLDVTDQQSIANAACMIAENHAKLDVLVNNAAIAQDAEPPSRTSIDLMRRTYETNVFGLLAVTQAMLPLLRRAPAARIVNMSSGAGSFARTSSPNWRPEWATLAYNSSKSAVNAITVQLTTELRDTPIKINAANPGYTATDMNQFRGERSVQQAAIAPVRLATLPDDGPSGGFFEENGAVPW